MESSGERNDDQFPEERTSAFLLSFQRRRFSVTINVLVAVLIVGVLVGGSLLFFSFHHTRGSLSNFPTTSIISSAGDLQMSMKLTSGPYFFSEMLAVDISLTNHSQFTYYLGNPFIQELCGYRPGVLVTGGNKPVYTVSIATDHSCMMGAGGSVSLKPGQMLTAQKSLLLTNSGKQTLTAETLFYSDSDLRVKQTLPLEKHWPTINIVVSSAIPLNRKLSFEANDFHIVVTALAGIPSHMVYLYSTSCRLHDGSAVSGNYRWESISSNVVDEPDCSGHLDQWDFAFGVPGYAVVSGNYPTS